LKIKRFTLIEDKEIYTDFEKIIMVDAIKNIKQA